MKQVFIMPSSDYEAIRNTVALYCIALDTKDFDLLDEVFTADVETVYPFGGKRKGIKDIKGAIQKRYDHGCLWRKGLLRRIPERHTFIKRISCSQTDLSNPIFRLAPVVTQHALTTQHIALSDNGQTAEVTTYFTGIHFGQGKWEGKEVTAWGKYTDSLTREGEGMWRINRREVGFFGRRGEEGVMEGE